MPIVLAPENNWKSGTKKQIGDYSGERRKSLPHNNGMSKPGTKN
jgi:hypothetical protein